MTSTKIEFENFNIPLSERVYIEATNTTMNLTDVSSSFR